MNPTPHPPRRRFRPAVQLPLAAAGLSLVALLGFVAACGSTSSPGTGASPSGGRGNLAPYARMLNLHAALVPEGKYARRIRRPMRPTYITVHSTQTYISTANAAHFARAQQRGYLTATYNNLGYLSWHFSVDQGQIYQHLPLNERGEHADYEGPGNKNSIGIEMCENRGNSRAATVERTAKLVAVLMKEYNIPLSHVVPHYHWQRVRPDGKVLGHKDCPNFLMDNGRPGAKWQGFLAQIDRERRKI